MKENLLISDCLYGTCCRYDGLANTISFLDELQWRYNLIRCCPEVLGGLPTPRPPAERSGSVVRCKDGTDVTKYFHKGALEALEIAKVHKCTKALLKAKSPSCGKGLIYDGSHSRRLIEGNGVTVDMLLDAGITVFTELEIDDLLK